MVWRCLTAWCIFIWNCYHWWRRWNGSWRIISSLQSARMYWSYILKYVCLLRCMRSWMKIIWSMQNLQRMESFSSACFVWILRWISKNILRKGIVRYCFRLHYCRYSIIKNCSAQRRMIMQCMRKRYLKKARADYCWERMWVPDIPCEARRCTDGMQNTSMRWHLPKKAITCLSFHLIIFWNRYMTLL